MSSSKPIKKRTLPSVPSEKISTPKTGKVVSNQKYVDTPPARALFKGDPTLLAKDTGSGNKAKLSGKKNILKKSNTPVSASPKLSKKKLYQTPHIVTDKLASNCNTPDVNKNFSVNEKESILDNEQVVNPKVLQQRASLLLRSSPATEVKSNYDNSSISVAVRVRPFSSRELSSHLLNVISMDGNVTILKNANNGSTHEFAYDYSFWSFDSINPASAFTSQEDVYNNVAKPLLDWSFEGYNTCLFAYGQTGSGKSYTIMGYEEDEAGVVPRFSKDLFERKIGFEQEKDISYSVEISFYEIYNEKIFDLLSFNDGNKQRLCVREHPDMGPYVQGLSKHIVGSHRDIQDWLEVGNKNRATAATGMNDRSSRSHSVFTIVLSQVKTERFEGTETQVQKTSKINLIDLAGSERAKKALEDIRDTQTANTRLKEGGHINKSLHTLGKVISLLSDMQPNSKKKSFIPYRDSVLTWLLKESLGGNARTTMLATISPAHIHYSETLSTLRYAQQARSIVNKAKVNEDPKSKLIREMLIEIRKLRASQRKSGDFGQTMENEVTLLRQRLAETQQEYNASTRSWQEKLAHSEKKQKAEAGRLRRSGVAFTKLEHRLPSLVNLNEDPQLAEVLLYILQEGVTHVGRKETENQHDIQLRGNLVADSHCTFKYENEMVHINIQSDAPTYVNGVLITDSIELHHGDRIVFGGDHFFRLNHPKEAAKLKEELTDRRKSLKNFEFAKDELLKKQNERLEAELEEARLRAEEEALNQIKEAQIKAEEDLKAQRTLFETQLSLLQDKLNDTTNKKKEAEEGHQSAQEIINQLRDHQQLLEDEILSNRKRLQMEAIAAKQILEETKTNHQRILSNLEKEKQKMQMDIAEMKHVKNAREKMRSSIHISVNQSNKESLERIDLLKLSLMLREANKISQQMRQDYVFTRDDFCVDNSVEIRVRIHNTQSKMSTLVNLERFEDEFQRMRDLFQGDDSYSETTFLRENEFDWEDDSQGDLSRRSPRLSLSNKSIIASLNESIEMRTMKMRNTKPGVNLTIGNLSTNDISTLSNPPVESTRLSSLHANTTVKMDAPDISAMKCSLFETILEEKEESQEVPIVARLIKLIFSIYTDWNKLSTHNATFTQNNTDETDDTLMRVACRVRSLKDLASLLCSVHEAVGLDELKAMSYSFKNDVNQTSSYIRNSITQNNFTDEKKQFQQLIFQLVEMAGAMSLAAVDHVKDDENESYFAFSKGTSNDLCAYFLKHQNRFLSTMLSEAMCTVEDGIESMKNLQVTSAHEMSDDLVDGVMNILTSITTLLQRCKDLLAAYADVSMTRTGLYFAKECFILRKLLTAIVDYNENIYNLLEHSKSVAANCDSLDDFLDVPIELADTTKRICSTCKQLTTFVNVKKALDDETACLLHDCLEKFEFAAKTVRVGVAIVIQEVESDLNINEERSIVSLIQADEPFSRASFTCPLNRTSLDVSVLDPQLQEKFRKSRRSSGRPDLFISKYMDVSDM